jgi:hypothetical protein
MGWGAPKASVVEKMTDKLADMDGEPREALLMHLKTEWPQLHDEVIKGLLARMFSEAFGEGYWATATVALSGLQRRQR